MKMLIEKSAWIIVIAGAFLLSSCGETPNNAEQEEDPTIQQEDSVKVDQVVTDSILNKTDSLLNASLLPNENILFSFLTVKGKKVTVALDTNHQYLVYRFGNDKKNDFEYPDNLKKSWDKFKYSYYMRGGGPQNEGMETNSLTFSSPSHEYVVYSDYYSPDNSSTCGIRVTKLSTKETTDIKGDFSSVTGGLFHLRDVKEIQIVDSY